MVVVPLQLQGTTISEVREHRETRINGCPELIEGRVTVPRGNHDALSSQKAGGRRPLIAFRCQGHDSGETARRFQQFLHGIHRGGPGSNRAGEPR